MRTSIVVLSGMRSHVIGSPACSLAAGRFGGLPQLGRDRLCLACLVLGSSSVLVIAQGLMLSLSKQGLHDRRGWVGIAALATGPDIARAVLCDIAGGAP